MTSHKLAQMLLSGPDRPVVIEDLDRNCCDPRPRERDSHTQTDYGRLCVLIRSGAAINAALAAIPRYPCIIL